MRRIWDRCEIPTLLLGLALYASWLALTWWHASIPAVLLFLAGGYVTQWHFSLQHESIHGMRSWPAWLRTAFVWPPLGLWMPYPIYRRSHSTHHINFYMTHPQRDTESFYHMRQDWPPAGKARRRLVMLNQTLAFRLVFGPFLRLWKLASKEAARVRGGDPSHLPHWGMHALSLAAVLGWVLAVCDMPLWKYLVCFAWPGMSLGMLRTFTEHRWGDKPMERVAIVESNMLMGILFLYNNLHLVHHRQPTLPWYRIPARWRDHRAEMLAVNGNFYYRGYLDIARRFMFRPVFDPAHPRW
ncbi:MAG: fatty acid desaturase [Alcaligenaceae bacterium]|nr:fatty acid desaturase [Alcaligenaceae bacterium SAGV5]MPS54903.1 fatty acid desaturase [Alcaligenaceae bacterium SAGV3]MPT59194.1 fatty acid desaturase [Alcaligenaceae bacterium]